MTTAKQLNDIFYITLPDSIKDRLEGFTIDSDTPIPVQLPPGSKAIEDVSEIGVEMIVAGMIKEIAWNPQGPHATFYRDFLYSVQPDLVKELNLAAIAKAQAGDSDFAEELFLAVNHLNPEAATFINLAIIWGKRASELAEKGNIAESDLYIQRSLEILQEGLNQHPNDQDLLAEAGTLHLYHGNGELAKDYFERFVEVASDGPKKDQILKLLEDIQEKNEDNRIMMEAFDAIQLGNNEQAIELMNSFVEKNPSVWNAWFLKGWAHRRLGQYEEGKQAFLSCLNLGETSADIYNELAICTLETGDRELAKQYLSIALDSEEQNIKILTNLAFLLLHDGEYSEARALLEHARAIDDQDPGVRQLLIDYQAQTGDDLSEAVFVESVDESDLETLMADHHHGDDCACGHHHHGEEDA